MSKRITARSVRMQEPLQVLVVTVVGAGLFVALATAGAVALL